LKWLVILKLFAEKLVANHFLSTLYTFFIVNYLKKNIFVLLFDKQKFLM